MTDRSKRVGGATALPTASDTFNRIRANCVGASNIDLDKHAAEIMEVLAVAEQRRREFAGRDELPAPQHP